MKSIPRPVFVGAAQLVALIGQLYQRPRFDDRPRELDPSGTGWRELPDRQERSGRRGLPMVCLVRPKGHDELLSWLGEQLDRAKPDRVPHALIQLDETQGGNPQGIDTSPLTVEDIENVRRILRETANKLAKRANGRAGRLRFPLFALLDWLMDEELGQDTVAREGALRKRLRRLAISQQGDVAGALKPISDVSSRDSSWLGYLFAALRVMSSLNFLVAITGRVPVISRQYRWFLRQQYLSPEVTGGFVSFAARLTKGQWILEDEEQVARLLISSFLEDLRRAYRWRPWQLSRVRRMTYVILLLDNITMANGGYATLRLINEVRNDLGRFDPLLVISASRKVPPDAGVIPDRPRYEAVHALDGYRHWQNSLFADRRAHDVTAWYLPLSIPGAPSECERRQVEQQSGSFDGYKLGRSAARPLWWSSRMLRVGVVLILPIGLAAGYNTWSYEHCGGWTRFPGFSPSLQRIGTECIGVTDGSYDIFQPSDQSTRDVETKILTQNREAERAHTAHPERPYITLVVVQGYTSSTDRADGLTSERESLEGVAKAQDQQLGKAGPTDPIVRVLIGNAGQRMAEGVILAQQLGNLAKDDPTLVGVVGLEMSTQVTVNTISALSNAGLPTVTSTLSADNLAKDHPQYFQVAPQNSREAAVAAAWADQQVNTTPSIPRSVRVYYSDDATDIYSTNLRDDAVKSFTNKGFQTEIKAFRPSANRPSGASQNNGDQTARSAGSDTCSYNGFVFYAGRGRTDYSDFLDGAAQCNSHAIFLGDDDVTNYVADAAERRHNKTIPFYYLSFTAAPAKPDDSNGTFNPGQLKVYFPDSMDGYAPLSYDAAEVLIIAVTYLRDGVENIPITPGAVWREITDIHTSELNRVHKNIVGLTGIIDYGGDITRHVPLNKPVAILRVEGGEVVPSIVQLCETDVKGLARPAWCPVD